MDFSSDFNTIQLHSYTDMLIEHFNLDFNLVGWILDIFTDRTQRARVNGHRSDDSQPRHHLVQTQAEETVVISALSALPVPMEGEGSYH